MKVTTESPNVQAPGFGAEPKPEGPARRPSPAAYCHQLFHPSALIDLLILVQSLAFRLYGSSVVISFLNTVDKANEAFSFLKEFLFPTPSW